MLTAGPVAPVDWVEVDISPVLETDEVLTPDEVVLTRFLMEAAVGMVFAITLQGAW